MTSGHELESGGGQAGAELRLETVRQLTPELQAQVNVIAAAASQADGGVLPFGEHKWLRLVRGDDRFSAQLVWRGGELVAAAHCCAYTTGERFAGGCCRLTAEMVVHPAHRRRGLGSFLLQGVVAQARVEGVDELHLWSYGNLPAARQMAAKIGCRPERTLLQLLMPAERLPAWPELPKGLRLRAFDPPRDAYAWLALHNRVFEGHPEQSQWEAGDLQARLEQPWFDPADVLLVERASGGALVGFCWVKLPRSPELPGEIYIVGVSPSQRGRGLGRTLTEAGLAHMRDRGRPGAMLYVEADNQAALSLYRRLGFLQHAEHVCYTKSLTIDAV